MNQSSKHQLKPLLQTIAQSADEEQLQSQTVPQIGQYFAASRVGVFFFDRLLYPDSNLSPLLKNAMKTALSTELNPIARYILERHAPVHDAAMTSPKAWRLICPRPDHWHVMAGPIVNGGELIGTLGCTREKSQAAFDNQDLADMSALCLHLSVWAATVRTTSSAKNPTQKYANTSTGKVTPLSTCLTARELQIAELVASGKKNAEVGAELWITENSVKQALKKIFRKLQVSSRTEMAMRLLEEKRS